jgi:hypothetical protein
MAALILIFIHEPSQYTCIDLLNRVTLSFYDLDFDIEQMLPPGRFALLKDCFS